MADFATLQNLVMFPILCAFLHFCSLVSLETETQVVAEKRRVVGRKAEVSSFPINLPLHCYIYIV